jgi:hypothetical protein
MLFMSRLKQVCSVSYHVACQLCKGLTNVRRLVSRGGGVEAVCRLEVDADVLVDFAQP